MNWQPFTEEPLTVEGLGQAKRYRLPAGGTLDVARGHSPGPPGQVVGTGQVWARLQIPVDRSSGLYYPHTEWFVWDCTARRGQPHQLVTASGGFLAAIPQLLTDYWQAYALALEDKLAEAIAFLENPQADQDDRPDQPVGFLSDMDDW